MKFPKELVEEYGAKAGMLMYVARELSDIPQARMIVKSPNESIDDFLKRADSSSISYPRIYRSSAVAELDGYEGDFLSEVVGDFETERARITNPNYVGPYNSKKSFDAHVKWLVERIEESTTAFREEGHTHLPEKINVIAAEKSPSLVTGTYVKHPNQKGFYLVSCSLTSSMDGHDAVRSSFSCNEEDGVETLWGYHWLEYQDFETRIEEEIAKIIPWHDRIAQLSEMDDKWSYQVEFGLYPTCLYQIRPFKEVQSVDFKLERDFEVQEDAIVIGTTPEEGLLLRVETDIYNKVCNNTEMNPEGKPAVLFDGLRSAGWAVDYLPNHQANILSSSFGFLAHNDIKAMRRAQVTVLYSCPPLAKFETGEMINLISDGKNFTIKRV